MSSIIFSNPGGISIAVTYYNCGATVSGCTDPAANNYDASANTDDGSCTYDVLGCTDPNACNYDASATVDDGSCNTVYGCMDPLAYNYDASANCDDPASCISVLLGCTDPSAFNYNSAANTDDGSCVYLGCTDPAASNYDANATIDDGSCTFSNCSFISGFTSIGSIGNCCYYVSDDTMSWTNANILCGSSGGSMVAINSQQESDSLNILLGNTPSYGPNAHWIGLIDNNNTWENGDPLTFTNYDASYTLNSGLYMYIQTNGFWDNSPDDGSEVSAGIYAIMEICVPVPGCTASTAINYDPNALIDGVRRYNRSSGPAPVDIGFY